MPEPLSRISQTRSAELLGPHRPVGRERVVGRRDQRELVGQERLAGDPLVVGRPAGDRDVDLVLEHAVEDASRGSRPRA